MLEFIASKLEKDSKTGAKDILSLTQDHYMTSLFEGFAFAFKEQQIAIKYLLNKSNAIVIPRCNSKCVIFLWKTSRK